MKNNAYIKRKESIPRNKSKYSKTVLDNGLIVLTEQVKNTGSVAFGIFIKAGSRDEMPGKEGIAHFMEHAAFRSTTRRSAKQIAMGFESVGTYSNAYTTQDVTCFYARSLKEHYRKSLRILCELTLQPLFKNSEIDKERQIIIEEIKSGLDDPEDFIFDLGDSLIFRDHALGNPIYGTVKSVKSIDINDLRDFHKKFYRNDNIYLSFSGDISSSRVIDKVNEIFDHNIISTPYENPLRIPPTPYIPSEKTLRMPLSQSHILLASRISGINSSERYALNILSTMLGGGMSSRLYQKLREGSAMAYNVYTSLQMYEDCGSFTIYAAIDKSNTGKAERMIFEEIKKMMNGKISLSEVKRAKEQIKSSIIFDMESLSARMQASARNEIMHGYNLDINETLSKYESVSLDEIVDLTIKYLRPDKMSKVVILPK